LCLEFDDFLFRSYHEGMADEQSNLKPITVKELEQFTQQIILPGVERIVEDRVRPIENNVHVLRDTIDQLAETVKSGFADIRKSIRFWA
jgi:hypothetical protein